MDTAPGTTGWRTFTHRYWGLEPVELAFEGREQPPRQRVEEE